MTWYYKNTIFTEELIDNHYGFVYIIENVTTKRKYIGKKFFTKAGTKQVNGKKKKTRKKSDWENYYGSNKVIQEEVKSFGPDNFCRTILKLCKTRSECAYWETHYIITLNALLSDDYYNDWLMVRVRKDNLKSMLTEEKESHGP